MKIPTLKQLKTLNIAELNALSDSLRERILSVVKANGGHLASNLGVVELTIALHYVFDAPKDKLIFDVGHQCYAHKLLTGRAEKFSTLRQKNGISGFPKQAESVFDVFDTGHASTALSLGAGLARARNLKGEKQNVVAIVGDGAFLGGESFEALNDLGSIDGNFILVLNDNNMTISESVGALDLNESVLKNLFDAYGFEYVGTVDGHDVERLISALSALKDKPNRFAIRVKTQKGKGGGEAQSCPEKFHVVSRQSKNELSGEFSFALGKKILTLAKDDKRIVAVTAAMTDGVGLREFANLYPDRLFDVGICEEHAVAMSAGLAKGGMKPYVAVYSSFLQRAFDQILNEVCINKLPVTFLVDHAGFVDGDGETHQGFYDISYLSMMPNMTIIAPSTVEEFEAALEWSLTFNAPLAIRYPKTVVKYSGSKVKLNQNIDTRKLAYGKWGDVPSEDIILLSVGALCFQLAKEVKDEFLGRGVDCAVKNATFVKPLDFDFLQKCENKTLVTIEDNVSEGGFGSAVSQYCVKKCLKIKHLSICVSNPLLKQGTTAELCEDAGFRANSIVRTIEEFFNRE